ncbi:hypothetical protein Vadar_025566 [Vaccinium darrowii]|uniref:Uncharacterized protein n=1 Tax=Vaccinium darrowii TaxID=229202 RepID=A0ACB7XTC8_9ERIC|nr:hypothetical protein Vadar_025566 [Vaccinium darrowii]
MVGNTSTKPIASLPPTNPPAIRAGASSGSRSKCFKCGEPGHRAFECRKGERPGKALFVDSDGIVNEQCESYEQEAAYDEEVVEEEVGDNGPLLVVRRLCYAPHEAEGDSWLRVLNEFGQTVDADNLEEFADNNKLYNVLDEGIQKDDGHVVLYGGHGGSTDV